jgi:hypothetical protein
MTMTKNGGHKKNPVANHRVWQDLAGSAFAGSSDNRAMQPA